MINFPKIKPHKGEWYYGARCSCGELIPIVDDPDEGVGPSALKGSGKIEVSCSKGHLGIYSPEELIRFCYDI